jgi:hypothetical protein
LEGNSDLNELQDILDEEGDIVCEDDTSEPEDEELLQHVRDAALQELHDVEMEPAESAFGFLPDSDMDMSEDDLALKTPPVGPIHRSLVEDDDTRTWQWHTTAGEILRKEPNIHKRWKEIFFEKNDTNKECYKPFASRLEWEISQWAVKEKIGQGSFNRLLEIPQV